MSNFEVSIKGFGGEIKTDDATLKHYSHDASMFELQPQAVVFPKAVSDIQKLVLWATAEKQAGRPASLTARSAGTDMSGGAINDSVIIDLTQHFTKLESVTHQTVVSQPGVFYRDLDRATKKLGVYLPSYPASRDYCTIGGMAANNSGGEKSLRFGKTIEFVRELEVVLADGKKYTIQPLDKVGLAKKLALKNFEGDIYRKTHKLVTDHYDAIRRAKPHVSKNSTGYNLWDVWNPNSETFDLTKAFVGSQGTLGIITKVTAGLEPVPAYSGILVCFKKDLHDLGLIINLVLAHHPESFESFDDATLTLAIKFFPYFRKTLGWKGLAKLAIGLIPDGFMLLRGLPKLVLMIEFTGQSQEEVDAQIYTMRETLSPFRMQMETDETMAKASKFWTLRRESFNLLRKKVKDKHTAPFIDDLVVPPPELPKFLPRLRRIIKKYRLLATIAGHMGDGNFHVIPLMDFDDPRERAKLLPAMKEVNKLVLKHGGILSGEHGDGLVRGPWLRNEYGAEVLGYFRELKNIFDPQNIFNPHKKTDADWDYSFAHIREDFDD